MIQAARKSQNHCSKSTHCLRDGIFGLWTICHGCGDDVTSSFQRETKCPLFFSLIFIYCFLFTASFSFGFHHVEGYSGATETIWDSCSHPPGITMILWILILCSLLLFPSSSALFFGVSCRWHFSFSSCFLDLVLVCSHMNDHPQKANWKKKAVGWWLWHVAAN